MVEELLRAAMARFPDDARFHVARRSIRRVVPDSPEDMVNHTRKTVRRGKFDRARGVLYIGTRRPNGTPLPPGVVRSIVVHEVAHAALTQGAHDDAWRDVYLRLLDVATADLGWAVSLECSSCRLYGLCSRSQCPACSWVPCKLRSSG